MTPASEPAIRARGVDGARPPAVVLAGGLARRMGGGDKGLLPLGDGTVLSAVLRRLEGQAGPVALNANGDPGRFAALGLTVLPDTVPGHPGPLAGVLAAMRWAAPAERVLTVAADTPFFPRDLAARLSARPGIVLATTPGPLRHPTFGLWPTALADDLEAALAEGVRKVLRFCDRHGWTGADFPDEAAFFNVNTPEDLDEARRRCG